MTQTRDIKFIDRDFDSFRTQLIEYSKNYFSDTYNDFSPTSPGMMFMEMAAYVGDVLSFYQDTQLQETFVQYARDPKNLYNLAYMLGYRPKVTSVSQALIEVSQIVDPDSLDIFKPDWSQAARLTANTELTARSVGSPTFLINSPIDFTYSSSFEPTNVEIQTIDISGNPTSFKLTKQVKAISGQIKTISRQVTSAEKFLTFTIEDTDIVGILDIVDNNGSGEVWYEVPYLGQETVFVKERNTNPEDSGLVYNSLRLKKTPKRFTTRFNSSGNLIVQFGAGVNPSDDSTFTPGMENVGAGSFSGVSRLDYAYDPSNFLYTRTYGLAPSNTTLRIRYIVGGGTQSNVPSQTITQIRSIGLESGDVNTVSFTNPEPASGGSDGDTIQEIRQNILKSFQEQGRVVTLEDYVVRTYSLPSDLGSIAKVYATQDQLNSSINNFDTVIDNNPLAISLYVLGYNQDKNLISASTTLKQNLKNYLSQYIMLTDTVSIKDAFVVNIGLEYDITVFPNQSSREVLLKCKEALIDYFSIDKWNINQPINLSEIYILLDKVKGVQTVQNIRIINKAGTNYSIYEYDIEGATRNNVIYPSLDPCIFEIKYPELDIKGRITTL